jgi:hypothetical protein
MPRHPPAVNREAAWQALGISPRSAERFWAFAQACLHRELAGTAANPESSRNLA